MPERLFEAEAVFYTADLFSKWGFTDGDILQKLYDNWYYSIAVTDPIQERLADETIEDKLTNKHDEKGPVALDVLLQQTLLPALRAHHTFEYHNRVNALHNPCRISTLDGSEIDWYNWRHTAVYPKTAVNGVRLRLAAMDDGTWDILECVILP